MYYAVMKTVGCIGGIIVAGFVLIVAFLEVAGAGTEKRYPAIDHEGAAATSLRGVMMAELIFQNGHQGDAGHPGAGEYGFMSALNVDGITIPGEGGTVVLAGPQFTFTSRVVSGYRFIIYLPDGPHAACTDPSPSVGHGSATAAALRQRYFVAYAWPTVDLDRYHRLLAIDQEGTLYVHEAAEFAAPPPWNALYGSGAWGDTAEKGWARYHQ